MIDILDCFLPKYLREKNLQKMEEIANNLTKFEKNVLQIKELQKKTKCNYCGVLLIRGDIVWQCQCGVVMEIDCFCANGCKCSRYGCKY